LFGLFSCVEGLIELLEHRRRQDSAYIGCMKSGEVVTEEYVIYCILF